MLSKLYKITSNIFLVLILFLGVFVVLSFSRVPGGIKLFTVMSGSMEPALHTGSVIFVKPMQSYVVGDIVTRATEEAAVTVTHRIVSKQEIDGQTTFETKGDANDSADYGKFPQSSIIGKEFLTVPFLGYAVSYAKTQQGMILLVVIPAIIIIYDEMGKIGKEIRRMRAKKLEKKGVLSFEDEKTKDFQ